jgi:hypothetical protein
MAIGMGVERPERGLQASGVSPVSGVAPPVETRWKPGQSGNISGKPKGSFSIRSALKRNLRKGWEEDQSDDGEQIGSLARKLAFDLAQAIDEGDVDKVRAIATVIDQAEGKPTEHRVNETVGEQVVILRLPVGDDPPDELPPGVE